LQPSLPDIPLWEGSLRLILAGFLAGLIGLERERREQEAGLRTHILVAGGSCLFMLVGVYAWADFTFSQRVGAVVDPSRVASYVVAGIGFLGGGAIIKYGANIKGLTTAASIWVTAAIGVAVGVGMYVLAAVERAGAHVESVRVSAEEGRRALEIVLSGETATPEVLDEVAAVDGVATVEWAR
jgi:uncharacterized membrane protein YhiD involved in acid resistance